MVGKWAIPPAQIAPALDVVSPTPEAIAKARGMEAAIRDAEAKGLGAAQLDGVMFDAAALRLVRDTLDKADLFNL